MMFNERIKKFSPDVKTVETAYFRNHEGSDYDTMPSVSKNMYVPVRRELICIIDPFFKEAPPGKSTWEKKCFVSCLFFSLYEIPKIKICHIVAKEHPEVI